MLAQEENVERVAWMNGIQATQKNVSWVGWLGVASLEEWLALFLKPTNLNRVLLNYLINDRN